ncbi:MAG: hypothetical protein GY945_02180 [Rhodobacteraceae bacterium]|nr:hypothetical protein [Paracoccaceae bacterium]
MFFASLALTGAIAFTTWVLLGTLSVPYYVEITWATSLVFFGFLSAAMIVRFLRSEVVLSIHHGGIVYRPYSTDVVGWEAIRSTTLELVEQELRLRVTLLKNPHLQDKAEFEDFTIDMSLLDGDPETIVASIERYQPVQQALSEEWQ